MAPKPQPKPTRPPAYHNLKQQAPYFYASPTNPISTVRNKFAGFCYCCGNDTSAGSGWLFDPWSKCSDAASKWAVACNSCNTAGVVGKDAALPVRNRKKPAVTDLA